MKTGKVLYWNEAKGYGFIGRSDKGKDIFVHVSALNSKAIGLRVDDEVQFSEQQSAKGLRAVDVTVLRRKAQSAYHMPHCVD